MLCPLLFSISVTNQLPSIQPISSCFFTLQVKIKRRQMLVRKGIDPIISHHEINKNKPKADGTTFLLLFSQQFLSVILL